jgi:uncharacterized C2H2 Zn-finger protein
VIPHLRLLALRTTKPFDIAAEMVIFSRCLRSFVNSQAVAQHQRDTGHASHCTDCGRSFKTQQGLSDHWRVTHSFSCSHVVGNTALESLKQHRTAVDHDQQFGPGRALQRLQSAATGSQFHCSDCDRDFTDQRALKEHLIHKIHHVQRPKAA